MKKCKFCLVYKEEDQFWREPNSKDGLRSKCKECIKALNRRWRQNNKEKLAESKKRYHYENRDKILAEQKERYEKNKEARRETNRRWREKNPEKVKVWRKRRKLERRIKSNMGHSKPFSDEIAAVYAHARDCQVVTGEPYHVDHVIPLRGENVCGLHVPWNLQVLPADVNIVKGNRHDL